MAINRPPLRRFEPPEYEHATPYPGLSFRMLKYVGRSVPPHPGPLPEERVKHRPTLDNYRGIRFADRLATILPLPGEGPGWRGIGCAWSNWRQWRRCV